MNWSVIISYLEETYMPSNYSMWELNINVQVYVRIVVLVPVERRRQLWRWPSACMPPWDWHSRLEASASASGRRPAANRCGPLGGVECSMSDAGRYSQLRLPTQQRWSHWRCARAPRCRSGAQGTWRDRASSPPTASAQRSRSLSSLSPPPGYSADSIRAEAARGSGLRGKQPSVVLAALSEFPCDNIKHLYKNL